MSDPSEELWSNDPNAPQIPSWMYLLEKVNFAGILIGAISYGIVVALFFRCMGVLLSPINPIGKGIKWALVVHTVALFSFLTVPVVIYLNNLSIMYIKSREFPGNDEYPPGPIGYYDILDTGATGAIFGIMFPLNQWLADGLLLHRCYVIYSMNRWVMAFPFLMYLASIAMGIAYAYQDSGTRVFSVATTNFNTSYLSICLSLNVLLTLMIVTRLLVHIRNLRKAIGATGGSSGLQTVITMLIESYAIYAATLIAYIVPWALHSILDSLFSKVLGAMQVIAPYLIIIRVANQRALTTDSISGTIGSMCFRSQGSTDGDGSLPDGDPTDSIEIYSGSAREPGTGDGSSIEEVPL